MRHDIRGASIRQLREHSPTRTIASSGSVGAGRGGGPLVGRRSGLWNGLCERVLRGIVAHCRSSPDGSLGALSRRAGAGPSLPVRHAAVVLVGDLAGAMVAELQFLQRAASAWSLLNGGANCRSSASVGASIRQASGSAGRRQRDEAVAAPRAQRRGRVRRRWRAGCEAGDEPALLARVGPRRGLDERFTELGVGRPSIAGLTSSAIVVTRRPSPDEIVPFQRPPSRSARVSVAFGVCVTRTSRRVSV